MEFVSVQRGAGPSSPVLPLPWVDVRDFGAIGDGVTDDTASIQNALSYAQSNYKMLIIPAGVYSITSSLNITEEGIIVFGEGRDVTDTLTGTVIKAETVGMSVFTMSGTPRHAIIRDLSIDGNSKADYGVYISGPKGRVDNCSIRNCEVAGIRITSFSSKITNCDLGNNADGILYNGAANNDSRISSCIISGNTKNGIKIDTSSGYGDGWWIDGNTLENNCLSGTPSVQYAHINIGNGARQVYISRSYHESDIEQTGYDNQRYIIIGDGCNKINIESCYFSCSSSAKFAYHVKCGASSSEITFKENSFGQYGTNPIENLVGANGVINLISNSVKNGSTIYSGGAALKQSISSGTSVNSYPNYNVFIGSRITSNQSVPSGATTKIQFNGIVDPLSNWNPTNYEWTVFEEGYYQVNATIYGSEFGAGTLVQLQLFVGGSVVFIEYHAISAASTNQSITISRILKLETGNLLSVRLFHNKGSNVDVKIDYSGISVTKVASQYANQ